MSELESRILILKIIEDLKLRESQGNPYLRDIIEYWERQLNG